LFDMSTTTTTTFLILIRLVMILILIINIQCDLDDNGVHIEASSEYDDNVEASNDSPQKTAPNENNNDMDQDNDLEDIFLRKNPKLLRLKRSNDNRLKKFIDGLKDVSFLILILERDQIKVTRKKYYRARK
jgi:hypothetical protein